MRERERRGPGKSEIRKGKKTTGNMKNNTEKARKRKYFTCHLIVRHIQICFNQMLVVIFANRAKSHLNLCIKSYHLCHLCVLVFCARKLFHLDCICIELFFVASRGNLALIFCVVRFLSLMYGSPWPSVCCC